MRIALFLLASFSVLSPLSAVTPPITVNIAGTPAHHELTFTTRPCYSYSVERSSNLQVPWTTVTPLELGTGDDLTFGFASTTAKLYYRVREHDLGFMTSPQPNVPCVKEDGVCFAFDVSDVPQPNTLAKICISKRPAAGGSWTQIGKLTEFATIDGIKFVRGPAVWIPTQEGAFEVKADALTSAGATLCTATRQITIGHNHPPTVTINALNSQTMIFTTTVSDQDLRDEVTRVEFYDEIDGTNVKALIGTDHEPPFGIAGEAPSNFTGIVDLMGVSYLQPAQVLSGNHKFTAKAYDRHGGVTESAVFTSNIAAGNARPRASIQGSYPVEGTFFTPSATYNNNIINVRYDVSDADGANTISQTAVYEAIGPFGQGGFSLIQQDFGTPDTNGMTINFTGWEPGWHTLMVAAADRISSTDSGPKNWSYPSYRHVYIRNPLVPNFTNGLVGNIVDENTASPSAQKFYGIEASSNYFTAGTQSGLELATGVLMTTGKHSFWNGDDISDSREYQWGTPGDTVLEDRIAGSFNRESATLEFDVNCTCSQLELDLQFGSEEYSEFFNDEGYHDAFVVTVDGVVVSLMPDCGDIIAANTVHPLILKAQNNHYGLSQDLIPLRDFLYVDGEIDIEPSFTPAVEYDGVTVRLRLHAFVTIGTHRVRISIADTDHPSDYHYNQGKVDSGLFIGEQSVRTINPAP